MGLRTLDIFYFFQRENRLYTSESDVHRRQIQTYKDGHRDEKVKSNPDGARSFSRPGIYNGMFCVN